jgi:hypothetical protein
MRPDKEIIKAFKNRNKSCREYWIFWGELTCEERARAFDLEHFDEQLNEMEIET